MSSAFEHDTNDGPCSCGAWHKPGEVRAGERPRHVHKPRLESEALLDAVEAPDQAWFYRQLSGVALPRGEVYTGGVMSQSEIQGTLRVIQLAQGLELDELGRAVECARRGSPDDVFRVGIEYPLQRRLLSNTDMEKLVDTARQIYSGWLDVGDRRRELVDEVLGSGPSRLREMDMYPVGVEDLRPRSAVEDLARSIEARVEGRVRAQMEELYARINRLEKVIAMQSREPAGLNITMAGRGGGKFDASLREFERLIGRTHRAGQVHDSVASHAGQVIGGGGGGYGGRISLTYRDVQHQAEPIERRAQALPVEATSDPACSKCNGTGRVAGVLMADGWPCECTKDAG